MTPTTSTKPYLIRAIYEWCLDNGYTPHLSVTVNQHTRVPASYVKEGQIILNISQEAAHRLVIGNEQIEFSARFGGVAHEVFIPIDTVSAIYAKENGQGLSFISGPEPPSKSKDDPDSKPPSSDSPSPKGSKPRLQIIK